MGDSVVLKSGTRQNSQLAPLQLYLNYWEIPPSKLSHALDELIAHQVTEFTAFVPWQHFEKDITHRLGKLLVAATERSIGIRLIVTPEPGIHYPFSGVPKDFASKPEFWAQDSTGHEVASLLPPVMFPLPSLRNKDVQRRYFTFIEKLQRLLWDFGKSHPHTHDLFKICVGGSFWKYYRARTETLTGLFGGQGKSKGGDWSKDAIGERRKFLQEYYSTAEFAEPTAQSATHWHTRGFDELNDLLFQQASEEQFRAKIFSLFKKKGFIYEVCSIDLITPEADPVFTYDLLAGQGTSTDAYSRYLSLCFLRKKATPWVHWTHLARFAGLAESPKQYLILKSMLEGALNQGGVLLDFELFKQLGSSFRAKLVRIQRGLTEAPLQSAADWACVSQSLWTAGHPFAAELAHTLGTKIKIYDSIESADRAKAELKVVILDPDLLLTRVRVESLSNLLNSGILVALSHESATTYSAQLLLKSLIKDREVHRINPGIELEWVIYPRGGLVFYSGLDPSAAKLAEVLVKLTETDLQTQVTEGEIQHLQFKDPSNGDAGTLIFNPTDAIKRISLRAITRLVIGDYSSRLVGQMSHGAGTVFEPGQMLELEIAPFGVIPLKLTEEKPEHGLAVRLERAAKSPTSQTF